MLFFFTDVAQINAELSQNSTLTEIAVCSSLYYFSVALIDDHKRNQRIKVPFLTQVLDLSPCGFANCQ